LGQIIEELKRRNVFRVAVAYVVASWLVLQVADIVLQGIEAPSWVMKVFLFVLALGFPFVMLFSWAYELTPEGLKKEKEVDRTTSITPQTGRKLNLVTIGMLVAVVAVVIVDRTLMHGVEVTTAPGAGIEDKSIAVLAFEDLSPEGDQEYFADGLSEELLNVLAKVGDLKVAGRTSSFAFKGTNKDLREIGELLNVAHILEGSVRKSGNRIRVTAQLIKADDGFHLFSETYDRELDDVFAVQDEIAQKISDALLTEIVGTEIRSTVQTDTKAYEFYLMARQRIHTRDTMALREASTMLDRALEIDPLYAPGLAQKALTTYLLSDSNGAYGNTPAAEALPVALRFVEQALAVDDDLAEGLAVKGLLYDTQNRTAEAIELLERALAINPTMSDAANWLALAFASQIRPVEARHLLEGIVERDPTYAPAMSNLVFGYSRTADFDKAQDLVDRVARIVGENLDVTRARGLLAGLSGRAAEGVEKLGRVYEDMPTGTVTKLWYSRLMFAIADYEGALAAGFPSQQAFALYELGEPAEAAEIASKVDVGSNFNNARLTWIARYRSHAGDYQALVDQIDTQIGGFDRLVALHDEDLRWGTDFLGSLAHAYLQVGDEERFRRAHERMRNLLELHAENDPNNQPFHLGHAEYAALAGDSGGALAALRAAHARAPLGANYLVSPVFDVLRGEAGFEELEKAVAERVDAERAKLGMPPYRPLRINDKRPSFVN
jgi:TolB-like protein/tetratricopeptide (TPR) repeat protein